MPIQSDPLADPTWRPEKHRSPARALFLTWLTTPLWIVFWFLYMALSDGAFVFQPGTVALLTYVGMVATAVTLAGAGIAIVFGTAPLYFLFVRAGWTNLPVVLVTGAVLGSLAFGFLPSVILEYSGYFAWQFIAGVPLGVLHALIFRRLVTGRWLQPSLTASPD